MDTFLSTYKILNSENLHLLEEIYTPDVKFIDPAHEIIGLEKLSRYFAALYANLSSIEFVFHDEISVQDSGYVQWDMTFRHPQLSRGNAISVAGATFIRMGSNGKVCYHRDYFDLGAMLYEQLPLLGRLLTTIRKRVGK
jgi:hypothetical protein